MKKLLLSIILVFTISVASNAQADGFFRSNIYDGETFRGFEEGFMLPQYHGTGDDYNSVPLSGGLLVLTALGAGYALKRTKK